LDISMDTSTCDYLFPELTDRSFNIY
jgi:hypothetical protein